MSLTDEHANELIPVFAVCDWMRGIAAITNAVGSTGAGGGKPNIYEKSLPGYYEEIDRIPKTILVRHSTGGVRLAHSPLLEIELDVFCYAPDPAQAREVYTAVATALKDIENQTLDPAPNTVKMVDIGVGADQTDPDAGWDLVFFPLRLMLTDVAAA